MVLGCFVDVHSWDVWSGQKKLVQLCIADWSVWPWVALVTLEAVTPVDPSRLTFLMLLLIGCFWLVLLSCSMGAYLWISKSILCIWVALSWLASWLLSLTGIRYWSCWRVSFPSCYAILGGLLEGVLPTGVIDRNQWRFWYPDISPESCQLSRWGSPCWFSPSRLWVRLGRPYPDCLDKLCTVPGRRNSDIILDGGVPRQWLSWIFSTDIPLLPIGSVWC